MTDTISAPSPRAAAEPVPTGRRCAARTQAGAPCRAEPMADRPYCFVHDPDRANRRREQQSQGGKTTAVRREEAYRQVQVDMKELSTKAAIRRVLSDLLETALAGALPTGRVQNIVSLLSLAARLADDAKLPETAPTPQEPLRIELKDFTNSPGRDAGANVKMFDCPSQGCDGRVQQGARQCSACLEPLAWKRSGE